jgi:hypothetical protein
MTSRADAQRALEALNQSTTLEGCRAPLVVKFADSDRDKQAKRAAQAFQFMNPMMMMYQQMAQGMGGGMGGMGGMGGGMGGGMAPRPQMSAGSPGMAPMGGFDLSQAYSGMAQFSGMHISFLSLSTAGFLIATHTWGFLHNSGWLWSAALPAVGSPERHASPPLWRRVRG